MGISTILLILVIRLLIGAVPAWPHSRGWGYGPSGLLGVVLVILIILLLMGRLRRRTARTEPHGRALPGHFCVQRPNGSLGGNSWPACRNVISKRLRTTFRFIVEHPV